MTRTAADVEREVEASRGNLDRTVDALREKMTPGQLFDEASRAMGGAGQQVVTKFVEQAKENPMPLAVMGLGLAWLMTTSGRGPSAPRGYRRPEAFLSGREGIGERVHAAGEKVSDLVSGAREKVSDAASSVGELSHTAADRAVEYGDRAQRGFMEILEREPLLLGAAGLLVGAAIGAALPSTDLEDRLVGPTRDKVLHKGKDLAQAGMQQAGDVAQTAYTALKTELQESADTGASPAERVEDAVRTAASAARGEANGSTV
jgi:hypothetical protein